MIKMLQDESMECSLKQAAVVTREYRINFKMSELKSCTAFKERFRVNKTIGLGGQAYVKEAFDLEKNEPVAIKIFKKRRMSLFALDAAHLEYSVVKSFNHKNILKAKGFFEDTDNLIIIYELLSTDLRTLLVELEAPLTESKIKEIFY